MFDRSTEGHGFNSSRGLNFFSSFSFHHQAENLPPLLIYLITYHLPLFIQSIISDLLLETDWDNDDTFKEDKSVNIFYHLPSCFS